MPAGIPFSFSPSPSGLFAGGFMVDYVCEPVMASPAAEGLLKGLFGSGKGSGAAMMLFILGVIGVVICLVFGKILRKYTYTDGQ